ncbi:50S ribosomal protein L21e [archaeon]|jgi:large subunit ribosomal protein L21e|nr:50S ribosomal protein L21e [archaeon]
MVKRKSIRTRGKLQLSKYFQRFKEGDAVAIVRERSLVVNFPERLQGKTGIVTGKKGRAYIIKIKDQAKEKELIVLPIHLKKIKQ